MNLSLESIIEGIIRDGMLAVDANTYSGVSHLNSSVAKETTEKVMAAIERDRQKRAKEEGKYITVGSPCHDGWAVGYDEEG